MQDTCVHEALVKTKNGLNESALSWTDALTYSAGLDMSASQEVAPEVQGTKSEAPVTRTDAQARLPMTAHGVVQSGDRLRFTKRFGETLSTPMRFRVVGIPERGPTGLVAKLSWLGPVTTPTP